MKTPRQVGGAVTPQLSKLLDEISNLLDEMAAIILRADNFGISKEIFGISKMRSAMIVGGEIPEFGTENTALGIEPPPISVVVICEGFGRDRVRL